ncbi:MAG: hypothetical protein E2P06_03920, partial [Acidobacteria bacterium]
MNARDQCARGITSIRSVRTAGRRIRQAHAAAEILKPRMVEDGVKQRPVQHHEIGAGFFIRVVQVVKRYLVLTDSGAGKKFGKILDNDIYKGFFRFYDLDTPKDHRPLFVYFFNTREA